MSKDLFDDSTMTFGEHLEVLRVHLVKALIGLVIAVILSLFFSQHVIRAIQLPVNAAMERHFGIKAKDTAQVERASQGVFSWFTDWWSGKKEEKPNAEPVPSSVSPAAADGTALPEGLVLEIDATDLVRRLHSADPKVFPNPPADAKPQPISVTLGGEALEAIRRFVDQENAKARTDSPDEAFMIYLKVSVVTGIVIASPWVFYQLWLFVAAGLYPHEQKYVHTYLPFSIFLFLGGALFCFFVVIPYVLDFLFQFNTWLGLRPEMKIGSWISFAMILSLMFGISFQLPLVMLFLERISIFEARDYREKRRIAILAISIISMVLTPSDPISMTLMMVPLCLLYELGILLCGKGEKLSPFSDGTPSSNRSLEPQGAKFPVKS